MKTQNEIKAFGEKYGGGASCVDAHVHTHLCDGKPEMTVANIARVAKERGVGGVILTPHFHQRVSDATETLYEDTHESILLALREEIDRYEREDGAVGFLLSTEADILDVDGHLSLTLSPRGERALDLVTPTMNYHPLLPLRFVRLTYGKEVNALHDSGEYARAAREAGGVARLLETMYETEANALRRCPYPCMLGHFFAAHSLHPDRNSWFGATEEHISLMREGARKVIIAARERGSMLDLTGVHVGPDDTAEEKMKRNGFLAELQRFTVEECERQGVPVFFGSDAHSLRSVGGGLGGRRYYQQLMEPIGK